MNHTFVEGELEFDFRGARAVERLDEQGSPIPQGMSLVDFVVEERGRILLIEVKDPSQQGVPNGNMRDFIRQMQSGKLINEKLVPKARDSYSFLHLMRRDSRPFIFVAVLGLDALTGKKPNLLSLKDKLANRIRHEAREPWKRRYIDDCVVVTPDTWKNAFPNYSLARRRKP